MFEKPGLFGFDVQDAGAFLPDEMVAAGFGWIAIQVHDGVDRVDKTDYPAFISRYRSKGLDVAGWGVVRTNPEAEANLAADRCQELDLHAFIADAEAEIGLTQGDQGQVAECFQRSDRWVDTFRKRTDIELGFSSYAILSQHDAHYVPWINAGAVAMPQTYVNEFDFATPAAGVAGAIDLGQPQNPPNGWPRHLVYPTVGNYDVANRRTPTAEEYAELLRQAKVCSFSIYLAERVKEGELQHYAGVCVTPEVASPAQPVKTGPAPAKPPLSSEQVPYTGPYYGPSDERAPAYGPTVTALKICMRRLGIGPIPDLDTFYSVELEEAMRSWQKRVGIRPATGHYGRESYDALRGAVTANGEHALNEQAIALIVSDVKVPETTPTT